MPSLVLPIAIVTLHTALSILPFAISAEEAVAAQSMKFQRHRMQFVEGAKGKIGEKRQEGPQLWDDSGKGFRQASLSLLNLIHLVSCQKSCRPATGLKQSTFKVS